MKVALLTTDSREHFKDYANPHPYFGTAPEALLEGFRTIPGEIEVHVVSCLQKTPISSPAKLAENIYYHALHVPNIGWMKTGYLGCSRAVRRKLQEIKPDIVHGQGTERDCAITAVRSGYPNILTIHGVMSAIYRVTQCKVFSYHWFARRLEAIALRRTNGVVAISPYVDDLVSPLTRRTWFIPNAIQSFFFTPAAYRNNSCRPPKLVNVGVISPRKRQIELLQRLSRLRQELAFEITFIGKATRGNAYAKRFKELLNSVNTLYGGFQHCEQLPQQDFLQLYDESDAMVHFSCEESFGLTFAEALARNLPLFASDVGAIQQIAFRSPDCQIFPVDDFDGIIASLKQWIQNRATTIPRAPAPNPDISSRYHPSVIAGMHLEIYHQTVTDRSAK